MLKLDASSLHGVIGYAVGRQTQQRIPVNTRSLSPALHLGSQNFIHKKPLMLSCPAFFFSFFKLFIYLFIYFGCVGSSSPCEGFLQLRQVGATPHRGARASHHRGLSRCGAQAPDAQAQQLWLTGPAAPRHAGSSQTRARTRVPRISRQTPNHCATREALLPGFLNELESVLFIGTEYFPFSPLWLSIPGYVAYSNSSDYFSD